MDNTSARHWLRHRPAVLASFAFAFGILAAHGATGSRQTGPELWLVALIVIASLTSALLGRYPVARLATASLAIVLLGFGSASVYEASCTQTPLSRLAALKPSTIMSVGCIVDKQDTKSGEAWTIAVDSLGIAAQKICRWEGRLLLYVPTRVASDLKLGVGDRAKFYSTIESYKPATNPHEFAVDLKRQLDSRTEAHGELRSKYDCYLISRAAPTLLAQCNVILARLRAGVVRELGLAIRDTAACAFVKAVVLGERTDMSKEVLDDFTNAGVSHILAVSGFNVAIVALVTAQLLRLLGVYWRRPKIALSGLIVLLYCAIVGFQPSVLRALLMIESIYLAQWLERKPDPLNVVFSAILLNLLLRPFDLFDVGFQLSYAAVVGLIVIVPEFRRLCFRNEASQLSSVHRSIRNYVLDPLMMSLGASLASMPIIMMHFYRVSFVGLAANIPIIPLAALITTLGFLLIPLTLVYQPLGQLYGDATTWITQLLLKTTSLSAHLPVASHSAPLPSMALIAIFIICLGALIYAKNMKQALARLTVMGAATVVLLLGRVPMYQSVLRADGSSLQVLFFDVGQGDCILLHTPHGKNYFVDFGTVSQTGTAVADRVVIPFLRAENEQHIAVGFISHMHQDHYGGAPSVLANCDVGAMAFSGERSRSALARALDSLTVSHQVSRRILSQGDRLTLDSGVYLYVLSPARKGNDAKSNPNAESLAFKLVYKNTSLLLLGDVERSEEEAMRQTYGSFLHSDVVKVAHHGSLTSSSRDFVKVIKPRYAVISVGENNRYGHPAQAVVRRWHDQGAEVLRTDAQGAILLESNGARYTRTSWQ